MASRKELPRALREVLHPRVVEDLRLKMSVIRNIPQEKLDALFASMCTAGIQEIIRVEQERFPGKTPQEIMREYHLRKMRLNPRVNLEGEI